MSDKQGEEVFTRTSDFPADDFAMNIGPVVEATVIPLFDKMDSEDSFNQTDADILLPSIGTMNRGSALGGDEYNLPLGLPEEFWSSDKLDTTVDIEDETADRSDSINRSSPDS